MGSFHYLQAPEPKSNTKAADSSTSASASASASAAAPTGSVTKNKKGLRLYARVLFVRDVVEKKSTVHCYIIRTQDLDKIYISEHKFHEFQQLQKSVR